MDVELTPSVVCVFDEAHNIEDIARDGGSFVFKRNQIDTTLTELRMVGIYAN